MAWKTTWPEMAFQWIEKLLLWLLIFRWLCDIYDDGHSQALLIVPAKYFKFSSLSECDSSGGSSFELMFVCPLQNVYILKKLFFLSAVNRLVGAVTCRLAVDKCPEQSITLLLIATIKIPKSYICMSIYLNTHRESFPLLYWHQHCYKSVSDILLVS